MIFARRPLGVEVDIASSVNIRQDSWRVSLRIHFSNEVAAELHPLMYESIILRLADGEFGAESCEINYHARKGEVI